MGLIMDLKNKLNEDNASNDNIILAQATPSTDSLESLEYDNIDFDIDAMWENTVWEEIQDVTTISAEVEQITAVAGVRGAEAEDEALEHLYYRRSMKKLSKLDLEKAYGKLMLKRDKLVSENQPTDKVDQYLSMLEGKISKYN